MVAQVAQFAIEVAGGLVALIRLFGQAAFDSPLERRGQLSFDLRRLVIENRSHRLRRRRSMKCPLTRQHFIEDHAKCKDVCTMVDMLSTHLLRRHVPGRPHHYTGLRGVRLVHSRQLQLGQAKVQNLYTAVFSDEQVLRLNVAMNDTLFMRRRQPLRDLRRVIHRLA